MQLLQIGKAGVGLHLSVYLLDYLSVYLLLPIRNYQQDICAVMHNPVRENKTNITFFKEKLQKAFDIKISLLTTSVYFSLKILHEIYIFRKSFFKLIVNYFFVKDDQ